MKTKSLLTSPSNVLPLRLKQTFPPMIWIFTEGEGDGIKSKLPFKIFFTLIKSWNTLFWNSTTVTFLVFESSKCLSFNTLPTCINILCNPGTIVVMHLLGPNTDLPTLNKLWGCSPIFYESSWCKNNQMENLLVLSSLIYETREEILNKFHFLVHLKTQKFSFEINWPLT